MAKGCTVSFENKELPSFLEKGKWYIVVEAIDDAFVGRYREDNVFETNDTYITIFRGMNIITGIYVHDYKEIKPLPQILAVFYEMEYQQLLEKGEYYE